MTNLTKKRLVKRKRTVKLGTKKYTADEWEFHYFQSALDLENKRQFGAEYIR